MIEKIKNSIFKAKVEAIIKRRQDEAIRKVAANTTGTKIENS